MTGITTPTIIIGVKEIGMLHQLLNEHKKEVIPDDEDNLNIILRDLGEPPEVTEDDAREVQLDLVNRFEVEIKEGEEEKDLKKKDFRRCFKSFRKYVHSSGKKFHGNPR